MKKSLFLLIFIFNLVNVVADEKKGLFFTFGAGYHHTLLDFGQEINGSNTFPEGGATTRFKVGYHLDTQHAVYFLREAFWFNAPYLNTLPEQKSLFITGFTGFAYSYYLKEELPSMFISAGLGMGELARSKDSNMDKGISTMIGIGYEFVEHFSLEANLIRSDLKGEDILDFDTNTVSMQLSLNYSLY